MTVRVGVIGTGRWAARYHIPAVLSDPRAELTAIVEPVDERRRAAAERFGVRNVFADVAELAPLRIDAAVVASPPAAHHANAAPLLDAGIAVLVEKPMTIKPADAWDLVRRAAVRRCPLLVGYPFHFTAHADLARKAVASGGLGDLLAVSGLYASPARHLMAGTWPAQAGTDPLARPDPATFNDPAVSGGGQGAGQLTHAIASITYTTGTQVTSVAARMRSFDLPVDLADALVLEFNGGAIGAVTSIGSLRLGQPSQWEFRYYCTRGFVLHDLAAGRLEIHTDDADTVVAPDLPSAELYPADAPVRRLIDLALGDHDNPAPGDLGAHVVDVVEAAYRSAGSGGVPVPTPRPDH